jgi:membrane-associated phospholipid phosphatase
VKRQTWGAVLFVIAGVCNGGRAQAQSIEINRGCNGATPAPLVSGTLHGIVRMPDKGSLAILGAGAGAALAAHTADASVTGAVRDEPGLRPVFKPGATIGGMPFEVGAAAALMAIGHSSKHSCLASLGSELLQAQFVGAAWTVAVKQMVRRDRPEGTGYSFPSGHATTAFASATVLQRRFGWKAGIPAYGIASYVAASRVDMQRHYLSDVIFGAAVGIVAGRTVTVGTHRFEVGPIATTSGAGIGFSLVPSAR